MSAGFLEVEPRIGVLLPACSLKWFSHCLLPIAFFPLPTAFKVY